MAARCLVSRSHAHVQRGKNFLDNQPKNSCITQFSVAPASTPQCFVFVPLTGHFSLSEVAITVGIGVQGSVVKLGS